VIAVFAVLALTAVLLVLDVAGRRWLRHDRPADRDHLDALHRIHERHHHEP
jgi:hypothetical protein